MLPHAAGRARAALPLFLALSFPRALGANEVFDARGFSLNRPSSTQLPFEHIDPLTGNLLLVFTDLTLPGNAGFDLVIQRTYNSKVFRDDQTFSTIDWDSWAGVGWSLHLGRVRTTQDDLPLAVEMPDGSSHKLFANFVGDSGLHVTRDYWLYDRNASPPTLQLPNGVVYTFDRIAAFPSGSYYRYPTRIQDPFGNKIEIQYGSLPAAPDAIQKITQYLGPPGNPGSQKREITFTTETVGSRSRLKSMTFLGRTWTYTHVASAESDKSLPTVLQPPVGRPWKFGYSSTGELVQVTTPNGGTITWTYGTQGGGAGALSPYFYLGSSTPIRSRVVTTRVGGGRDVPAGTRKYWYAQGSANNQTIITEPATCAGSSAGSTTEYTFLGVGDDFVTGSVWKIGLLAQRVVKEGATVLDSETLSWRDPTANDVLSPADEFVGPNHDSGIYAPVLTSRTITRGGQTYVTTNSYHSQAYSATGPNFNDYGRPWQVVETGDGGTRTTVRTFKYGFTPFIKDRVDSETVTVGAESFKRSWVYDLANGFLKDTYDWGPTTTSGVHLAYGPTAVGNVDSVTDANGDTTTYTYDWGGRKNVRTPAYPGVDTIRRVINVDGTVQSETSRLNENSGAGYTTRYLYDALMRPTSITPPVGAVTSYDYDNANTSGSSFVKRTRGASFVQTYLDGFGRESGSTNAVGAQTDVNYDACERRSYESLPFDARHAKDTTGFLYQYDALGRTTNRTNPGSPASSISYRYTGPGLTGLDVEITDEEDRKTVQRWTAFGDPAETRLASVTLDSGGALAQTTSYEYNALGSLTSVSGAGSRARRFTYTTKNQLETETHPEQGTTTYTYYPTGRLQTATNALGTVTKHGYDENQRLTCVDQSPNASPPCSTLSADDLRVGYDRAGNRTSLQNTRVANAFEFDGANRLTKRTDAVTGPSGQVPFVTSYSYDARDNLELLTYPAPSTTVARYQYDNANRIIDVRRNGSATPWANAFSYHPSGAPESFTTGDGVVTATTYTGRHWPDVLKIGVTADPRQVLGLDYGYDKVGNPTSIADDTTGRTGMSVGPLVYDHLDRLTSAPGPWGAGSFGVNAVGDRTSKTIAGAATTYSYNATTGRLEGLSGAEADSFGYDNVGNLLTATGTTFTYTLRNMLQTATTGGVTTTYRYDGDDARSVKTGAAGVRYFVHGPGGLLLGEYAACGAAVERVRDYVYAGTRLLAVVREAPTVSFAAPASSVVEGPGASASAPVTVSTVTGCPTTSEVTVSYATANGTATAGQDYTPVSGTLRFPEGSLNGTVQTIQVPILDDAAVEGAETFRISLAIQSGALVAQATHTVTIQDDEMPAISFTAPSSSVSENGAWLTAGPAVKFVTKDGNPWSGAAVTVSYAAANGTALAGSDYLPTSGTLTFPTGTASGTATPITPGILADVLAEGDETFSIAFSNPVGARIDTPSTHVVTIADDDVRATMTVSGRLEPGGSAVYTVTISRPGTGLPGTAHVDLADTLPVELTLTHVTATSGTIASNGHTATWAGLVPPLGTVTLTLEASIASGTAGQQLSNQGSVHYDGNGDGVVEVTGLTDDPGLPGAADPTVFEVDTGPLSFYTLSPCRLIDTRSAAGPLGGPPLAAQADRTLTLRGVCNLPTTAKALAVNVTVTQPTSAGYLQFHRPGLTGKTWAVNYAAGQTRGNNAIIALDADGRVAVFCGQPAGTVHMILDVNGYFE